MHNYRKTFQLVIDIVRGGLLYNGLANKVIFSVILSGASKISRTCDSNRVVRLRGFIKFQRIIIDMTSYHGHSSKVIEDSTRLFGVYGFLISDRLGGGIFIYQKESKRDCPRMLLMIPRFSTTRALTPRTPTPSYALRSPTRSWSPRILPPRPAPPYQAFLVGMASCLCLVTLENSPLSDLSA